MHMRIAALGLLLGIAAPTAQATAMEDYATLNCLEHDYLTSYLDRAYGENRVASAELENGNAVELFASRAGSWTLVEVQPDGQGCVQASGERMRVEQIDLTKRRGKL